MNIQQLEYIIAVDNHRHFAQAAQSCYVTQATLSMMIKKLEEELDIVLFDRSKHPVEPTAAGYALIEQARIILREISYFKNMAQQSVHGLQGELRIGIIPTLAPYLLPHFLPPFLRKYQEIKLKIYELTTEEITDKLAKDDLDIGILATPLNIPGYQEIPLFYEPFQVYVARSGSQAFKKKYLLPEDIDLENLWLLEEGHCLRSQIMNLCELQKQQTEHHNMEFGAGSIESLLKIVDINQGITILPELAAIELPPHQKKYLRAFKAPVPVREISLVTHRHYIKKGILEVLCAEIRECIQPLLPISEKQKQAIVEIGH
ncbi:MAG: LysR family transcriptional regulator [Saprospiraceae bacterium]|nr:LysR family transcriptional regulator [Saprospiraceae bacterium]